MSPDLPIACAATLWLLAIVLGCAGRGRRLARIALTSGTLVIAMDAVWQLPAGMVSPTDLWPGVVGAHFRLTPDALWLLLFGAIAAFFATALGSPSPNWRSWVVGAALSMLGALGCFGLQDAVGFLVAWEVMSLGGAVLLIGERLGDTREGHGLLFMLALLEVGAVALLAAMLIMSHTAGSTDFSAFATLATHPSSGYSPLVIGLLLLIGFGAKLGLLPFYEWYPGAYGQGSGASGALLSGMVLNAAFFALERGFTLWLPGGGLLAIITVAVGVFSAILSVLYAFQEDDWRRLLALSSAENAAIAVTLLGASQIFRGEGLLALASLGFIVALLHLAGHSLAKGALMLGADGAYCAGGSYELSPRGWMRRSPWFFGLGLVFAGMSLAAMPPQAGFVSEWYTFQTLFQSFHLAGLAGRLTLSLAGAGMALTAAIAFATFVKLVGLGLLGRETATDATRRVNGRYTLASGLLGLGVLLLAAGMPWWLQGLNGAAASRFAVQGTGALHKGLLLVPLTDTFAFISPTLLLMVCPVLALIPVALLVRARLRYRVRRVPVWYGGYAAPSHGQTTALTFSNAMRTFYRFIYRPTSEIKSEDAGSAYFVRRLHHRSGVFPLFEKVFFIIPTKAVQWVAHKLGPLQSGNMNFYLGVVGLLLVLILGAAVF